MNNRFFVIRTTCRLYAKSGEMAMKVFLPAGTIIDEIGPSLLVEHQGGPA